MTLAASSKPASQPNDNRGLQQQIQVEPSQPLFPIIATGIGVTGGFAIAVLSHYLARRREAVARFAQAAKDFRSAFVQDLAWLEGDRTAPMGIDHYLSTAFEARHRAALAVFEHFVPAARRAAYKAAWQQYQNCQQLDGELARMDETAARKIAAQRMRELLKFASHG
jgi:hypothetical protein